jgi:autophagy-related protein 5
MSAATPFRSLVFRGTVPLQVQLEPQDLPLLADRSVEYYYVRAPPFHPSIHFIIRLIPTRVQLQVPRISYLALCLDDIKRNLVQLVLDHAAFAALKDDDLWFETLPENQHHQAEEGIPLRW